MLSNTLLLTLVIFLPGLTLCAGAITIGIRGILKLGLILLAGIAVPGYVLFGIYLASARIGYVISEVFPFVWGILLAWLIFQMGWKARGLMLRLLIPVGLTFFAALGILSLGYLFGGKEKAIETAWSRFSHPLPPDNEMPLIFAEGLRHGYVHKPLLGDWLSSDRPPLQTDFILALEPIVRSRPLDYQIAGVILQSLWIIAVWLMLKAFRISALTTALVLLTTYLSGFVIVNSFFVWPKLLAAAYFVAFSIPILLLQRPGRSGAWWMRVLWAFLLACSLLSHGGSIFALFGILAFMIFLRRWMLRESIITGLLVVMFYAPWMAYQRFGDPPGDRLIKYHLAGVEQVTSKPVITTIYDAYRQLSLPAWLAAKRADLAVLFGKYGEFLGTLGFGTEAIKQTRVDQFFYFAPTLGFVAVGVIGVLMRRKSNELRAARALLICATCILIPTILLMFEVAATVVHGMSYAMILMALMGCVLGLRVTVPRIAIVMSLAQCAWTWFIYQPDLRGPVAGLSHGMLNLNLGALIGLVTTVVLAGSGGYWRRFDKRTEKALGPPK
jgi:hypothetical protein